MKPKGKYLQWILVLSAIVCFALAGLMIRTFSGKWESDDSPTTLAGPAPNLLDNKGEDNVPDMMEKPLECVLYVTGEVNSPGIYRLSPGARAYQLVEAAGGLTPFADEVAVNLAMPLKDGDHLHVPKKGDSREVRKEPSSLTSTVPVNSVGVLQDRRSTVKTNSSARIDINRATVEELVSLPGIGPRTAEKIVQYRENVGAFRTKEELMKVNGVGSKKLDAIIDLITVR